jgi:biopolymer transport protein ExbD
MEFRRSKRLALRATLDMTPLIDMVLLLLLFFMLSSSFVLQSLIPIQAATVEGPPAYEEKDLSITLVYDEAGPGGQGRVYVNDVPVTDMEELSRILAEALAQRPDIRVLIRPDARIESGRLIDVLARANRAGIERYSIAAEPLRREPGK